MDKREPAGLRQLPEVRAGVACFCSLVVVTAGERLDLGVPVGVAVLGLTVVVASVRLSIRLSLLVAVSAWGLLTGFVVNQGGQLTFGSANWAHLIVMVGLGVATSTSNHVVPAVMGSRFIARRSTPPAVRL